MLKTGYLWIVAQVRDRVCAPVRRDNARAQASGLSTIQAKTMLWLTCTVLSSGDLVHYGISRAKSWASVNCDTSER